MDFRDLTYVIAIAKYQNITRAAESLYISQPTLTKFLQHLESDIGQKLFKKLGNQFVLTYAGERYVARAQEILNMKKELDREMGDIIKNNAGSLKIAFPVMRGTYMLPCTLPVFNKMYPNVTVDVLEAHSSKLENMVLQGEADLAFFNMPVKDANIDYEIIKHEELILVMAANHPLAKADGKRKGGKYPWIDLNHLRNEEFIMQLPGQRTRQTVDRIFREYGFFPKIKLQTSNISAAVNLAASGYGPFFVTESHLNHIHVEKKLACFSVGEFGQAVDFVAAFRRGSYLPYHAKEYIKIVKDFT